MIASARGLAVAAVIAVALAALAAIDVARTPSPGGAGDHALVPGFDPARVTALVWERPGQPAIRVERAGDRWGLHGPAVAPVDPAAIGDVLAALRGARWHRRGDAPPAHATLIVAAGDAQLAIGFSDPIAGTEQAWITVDGRGAVVDRWVVRALDRDRLGLQIRRPLAEVAGARSIAITGAIPDAIAIRRAGAPIELALAGRPRRLAGPAPFLVAPELVTALERALRDLAITRGADRPVPGQPLAIRAGTAGGGEIVVEIGDACPGAEQLIAMRGTAGEGCVDRAQMVALAMAVARLESPAEAIAERRPVPIEAKHLVLGDGAKLEIDPPRIGEAAADPVRVAELLAALAAPGEIVRRPSTPPTSRLTARDRSGAEIALDVLAGGIVARRGEPIALRIAPGAWRLATRPSRELRDPALWFEEPTTIAAIAIDGVRYQRGTVIGAWAREPAAAGSAAPVDTAVEALAAQLAAPRAIGFATGPIAVAHRVVVDVAPPAGAAIRHAIELGAPTGAGCPARIAPPAGSDAGGDVVALPAALCAAVAALAR
jgi:hypothetical protein